MDEARASRLYPLYERAAAGVLEARGFLRQPDIGPGAVKQRFWRKEEGFRAVFFRLATRRGDLLHVEPEFGVEILVPEQGPILIDARPVYFLANGRHMQYALPFALEARDDEAVVSALVQELDIGLAWTAGLTTKKQILEALASRDRNGVGVGKPKHQLALKFVSELPV